MANYRFVLQEFCKVTTKFPDWHYFTAKDLRPDLKYHPSGAFFGIQLKRRTDLLASARHERTTIVALEDPCRAEDPNRINDGRRFDVGIVLRLSR